MLMAGRDGGKNRLFITAKRNHAMTNRGLPFFKLIAVGAVLAALTAPTAQADQLVFKNGDRLSGQYQRTEDGYLFFVSEVLGEIKVNEADAKVERDGELPSAQVSPIAESVVPPTAGQTTAAPGDETSVAPSATVAPALPPVPQQKFWLTHNALVRGLDDFHLLEGWKSKIVLGYVWHNGETSNHDFTLRFATEHRYQQIRELLLDARWDYSMADKRDKSRIVTQDLYAGKFRWREEWVGRIFAQTNTAYFRDNVRQIDHNLDQSLGVGWKLLKTDRWQASLVPSVTAKYESVENVSTGWVLLGTLFQDLRFAVNDRLTISQESKWSVKPSDFEHQYYIDFLARLEAKITSKLSLNLIYDYNWNSRVGLTLDKGQARFTTAFGYDF